MRSFCSLSAILASFSLLSALSGCMRSDAYKKDRDFYEETPGGYYADNDPNKLAETGKRLEKLKGPKKKVLVLSFWNDTPVGDEELGNFAGEELRRELGTSRRILFPDEKLVTANTQDFVQGDRVQISQLVREGRRFGVSSVIVGRITKIKFRQNREEVGILREAESALTVDLEMKVFDVTSGREVSSYKRTGVATNTSRVVFGEDTSANKDARAEIAKGAIHEAVLKLVPDALVSLDKMDWQGRIAKILGSKVYLNAGRASGLLAGDILKVLSPGEEIVDPVTKAFLGHSEGFLKGTVEVSEFIGTDSAMSTIHTGGNFQEGDVVRLY